MVQEPPEVGRLEEALAGVVLGQHGDVGLERDLSGPDREREHAL
jgi:hypothetical protein